MAPVRENSAVPGLKTPLLGSKDPVGGGSIDNGDTKTSPTPIKKTVAFTALYRYASRLDIFAMAVALIASLANGAAFPLLGLLFGSLLNALQGV